VNQVFREGPARKLKKISINEQLAVTQWIQADSSEPLRIRPVALGIFNSHIRRRRRRTGYRFYKCIPIQKMFPDQYTTRTAFAMGTLPKGDPRRIIIFSDEASVIEDSRKHRVWKIRGQ
jgi:hypothetical protein